MAPLRQMVGQALQDHLRRKIVEEELKSSSALLRDAKEAVETEERRRANEDALLHTYHDTLVANGVTGYDFDTFFDDYRLGVMYGWIIPVFAVGTLDVSSERAMNLWRSVIDRVQTCIADHNAGEFLNA